MQPVPAGPLANRFEIRSTLGAGGMGVVYEAYDHERGATVALKTLVRMGPTEVHQLKREFRALADIVHPNLVQLHELVSDADGQSFFTMDLVPGIDFMRYVRNSLPSDDATLPVSHVRAIEDHDPLDEILAMPRTELDTVRLRASFLQLCQGLGALHHAGKIHRDLKPSNVLVRDDGRLVILDFGLVHDLRGRTAEEDLDGIVGTPAYMSPEHASGEPLSPASDWYSVGVMLYEALTGILPISGGALEVLQRKRTEDIASPASLVPDLPSDLAVLCERLLDRRPHKRPSEAEIFRALGAEPESLRMPPSGVEGLAFVGREDELDELRQAVDDVRAGGSVVVYLHGKSGMGKSALAERIFHELGRDESVLLLRGRCFERESVPYKAVDSLIDALGRHLAGFDYEEVRALVPRDAGALVRIFPSLSRIPALEALAESGVVANDEQEVRWRGFAALKFLLAGLGERHTLVLHVDDLQWGDLDGARLLVDILRPPDAPKMLFLGSYRSEEEDRSTCVKALLAEAKQAGFRGDVRHIEVEPLSRVDAFELAITLLSGPDRGSRDERTTDDLADTIARESAGSPFFVWELTHAAKLGDLGEVSLSRLLETRVKSLTDDARRLLETVAAAGSPVPQGLVAEAANVPNPHDALALLRSHRLVRARGISSADRVEAYHDRIRELVIERLPEARRAKLNLSLAAVLERGSNADPEKLAEHWRLGGDLERAGAFAELAADRAARALAFDRAARLYRLALERTSLDPSRRRGLEISAGDALANAGRGQEAAQAYLRAAEHAETDEALELRRRAGEQLLSTGHIDEGLAVLQGVLDALDLWLPRSPRVALASYLARRAKLALRGTSFTERAPSATDARARLRIDTCWALTLGLNGVDMIRGADFAARSLILSLEAGDPYRIGRSLAFETTSAAFVGGKNRDRAERLALELTTLADRLGDAHLQGFALLVTGMCEAFAAGRWVRALSYYQRAEKTFREECRGVPWEVATTDMVTSWSLFYTGRIKELGERLPSTLKAAEQRRDLYAQANLTTSTAWVMLAADEVDAAREHPVEVMARWSRRAFHLQHYVALLAETYVDRYAGRGERAFERFQRTFRDLDESMLLRVQSNRIVAHYERASSALAAAESTSHVDHLLAVAEKDARALSDEKMRWAEPYARLVHAAVAFQRGDEASSLSHLFAAQKGFSAADMRLYAAAVQRRRGEISGGDEGRTLVRDADATMVSEEIENPARWTAMLAPGFRRTTSRASRGAA